MGAWGEAPFDNDNALDWLGDTGIQAQVAHHVEKALQRDAAYDEWRAAAELLIKVGAGEKSVILGMKAKDRLVFILADEGWLNHWSDSKAIIDSLNEQIEALDVSLEGMNPDYVEHVLTEEVKEANPEPKPGQEVVTTLGQNEVTWIYEGDGEEGRWRKKA